jgi:hypothetical protein
MSLPSRSPKLLNSKLKLPTLNSQFSISCPHQSPLPWWGETPSSPDFPALLVLGLETADDLVVLTHRIIPGAHGHGDGFFVDVRTAVKDISGRFDVWMVSFLFSEQFFRITKPVDTVILIVFLATMAVNVALSICAIWHARGFRRFLASLPLLSILGVSLNILLAVSRDPTSHNLWPFEVLLTCAAGIIYSLAFLGLQAVSTRRKQHNEHETSA